MIADQKTYFHHQAGKKFPTTVKLLNPKDLLDKRSQEMASTLRSLAILLTAIDTRYWPDIFRSASWFDKWAQYSADFDAQATMEWLDTDVAKLEALVERFTVDGSFSDPTGDFYDLIRRSDPQFWLGFKGDLRIAMDWRIAAELIHLFLRDLGATPRIPTDSKPLSQQHLSERGQSLDESLTRTGLSPHPSLVIGVEGATEAQVLPKVFEHLDVRLDPSWIRIENYGGVDKDLLLLAQFAGSLAPGQDRGPFVTLAKPVTRLLVLADQEKKYRDAPRRRKEHKKLLEAMISTVPSNLQKHLRTSKVCLCSIRTWGKYPFEFAHFTDGELARAVVTLRPQASFDDVRKLVAGERRKYLNVSNGNGPNIDRILEKIPSPTPERQISKPELAEALWPVLAAKISRARITGKGKPPIMAAAERAVELASLPHRSHMALTKTETPNSRRQRKSP
jgi:hypothetical protein